MKILFLSAHPYLSPDHPTGYGTHIREVISGFRAAGYHVETLIAGQNIPVSENANKPKHHPFLRFPGFRWGKESLKDFLLYERDLSWGKRVKAMISNFKPDFIYERASHFSLGGVLAAKSSGVPHFLEINAPLTEEKKKFFGTSLFDVAAGNREKKMLTSTTGIITVSTALTDYFIHEHSIPPQNFLSLPNAVDEDKFNVSMETIEKVKNDLGWKDCVVIGFAGSIFPWHGVERLIHAFHEVFQKHKSARLLIAGGGESLSDLISLAADLQLKDYIKFTGNIPPEKMQETIAAMDIAVMANSNWYGSPVKIFEYGASGKPMIAPDNGPVREIITDGLDGILIKEKDSLSEVLEKLINDPNLRRALGNQIKTKINRQFTWKIHHQKTMSFIFRMMENGKKKT